MINLRSPRAILWLSTSVLSLLLALGCSADTEEAADEGAGGATDTVSSGGKASTTSTRPAANTTATGGGTSTRFGTSNPLSTGRGGGYAVGGSNSLGGRFGASGGFGGLGIGGFTRGNVGGATSFDTSDLSIQTCPAGVAPSGSCDGSTAACTSSAAGATTYCACLLSSWFCI